MQQRSTYSEIELSNGKLLDLRHPDPTVIDLEAVAQGLGNTCRYTGQLDRRLSGKRRYMCVAEHALLVTAKLQEMGFDPVTQLWGLHHDDAEAFLGDLPKPLKNLLPSFAAIEYSIEEAIRMALAIPEPHDEATFTVKEVDNWAMSAEAWHLMPSRGIGWWSEGIYLAEIDDLGMRWFSAKPLPNWEWSEAWMQRHHQLLERRRAA